MLDCEGFNCDCVVTNDVSFKILVMAKAVGRDRGFLGFPIIPIWVFSEGYCTELGSVRRRVGRVQPAVCSWELIAAVQVGFG